MGSITPPVGLDPCQNIADNARRAQTLFSTARSIPRPGDMPTTSRPPRTTVTTTVSTQVNLLTQGIRIANLARQNLEFFDRRSFFTDREKDSARRLLAELTSYLQFSKDAFIDITRQNQAFLDRETSATQRELSALAAELNRNLDPERQAMIQSQVHLSNLRLISLHELSEDLNSAHSFFNSL